MKKVNTFLFQPLFTFTVFHSSLQRVLTELNSTTSDVPTNIYVISDAFPLRVLVPTFHGRSLRPVCGQRDRGGGSAGCQTSAVLTSVTHAPRHVTKIRPSKARYIIAVITDRVHGRQKTSPTTPREHF